MHVSGRLPGLARGFRQPQPLRSHFFEDGARLPIGRNLRQLQTMGGEDDVMLSFVDSIPAIEPPRITSHCHQDGPSREINQKESYEQKPDQPGLK
jgi:hypothetical protein